MKTDWGAEIVKLPPIRSGGKHTRYYICPPMPASRARFAVIFFTVLIDLIGFGIVMPILPFYAQRFGASGLAYGVVLGVSRSCSSSRPRCSASCPTGSAAGPCS